VSEFRWVLQDESGNEIRTTEAWATKEEAEAWIGAKWQELVDEGGAFVSLREDDEQVYRMSLAEA